MAIPHHISAHRSGFLILSGALLSLLVACGGGGSDAPTPLTTRTLSGSMTTTRYYGSQEVLSPLDLSAQTIAGLVPEGTGYRTVSGTGKSDGSYSIPNLPGTGPVLLKIQHPAETIPRFFWSDGTRIDIDFPALGNPAIPVGSSSSARMNLDPNAPGLFVSGADILSPQVGFAYSYNGNSWPASMDWNRKPLLDTSRDQDLIVTGLANGTTSGGDTYRWITGYAKSVINPFAMQDGLSTSVQANLVIQGTPLNASVKLDRSAFSGGLFNPRAVTTRPITTEYRAQFLGVARGPLVSAQARILTHSTNTLTGTLDTGSLSFGDPFPSTWTRLVRVAYGPSVPFTMGTGTGTYTANLAVSTASTWKADALPSGNLAPLVGPLANLKANGQSLFNPLTGQGSAPLLTWDAPTQGQATHYAISVIDLNTFETLAYFLTPQKNLLVPQGLIPTGSRCVFLVTAIYRQGGFDASHPFASGWPSGTSQLVSEPYIP